VLIQLLIFKKVAVVYSEIQIKITKNISRRKFEFLALNSVEYIFYNGPLKV
jgi:hypothetical protein